MCGIIGAVGNDINPDDIINLIRAAAIRGTDATGLYISRMGDDNCIIKNNLPAESFVKDELVPKSLKGAKLVIGHTRAYTIGSPNDNANNHPLYGDNIVLVHNGCCSQTPRVKDYPYKGKVDSEIPLSLLETKGNPGLRDINGSAALAWALRGDSIISLWRTSTPCVVTKVGEAFYFASTAEILKKALGTSIAITDTDEGYIYHLGFDKDGTLVFLRGKEKYSQKSSATTTWGGNSTTYTNSITKKYKATFLVEDSIASDVANLIHEVWQTIAKTDISMTVKQDNKMLITVRNLSEFEKVRIEATLQFIELSKNMDASIEETTVIPAKTSTMGI